MTDNYREVIANYLSKLVSLPYIICRLYLVMKSHSPGVASLKWKKLPRDLYADNAEMLNPDSFQLQVIENRSTHAH